MNDHRHFGGSPDPGNKYAKLASWLQGVLQEPPPLKEQAAPETEHENQLELLLDSHYHLRFYQQLPDFIMALLTNDPTATTRYAPLLYHLASCSECRHGYLDLYDAMSAAIHPQEPRPLLGQGTRTLAATPQRMLGHLCQTLISQAEAVRLQARRDHNDDDAAARLLLQQAISISARITQSGIRRSALRDLVRVATLGVVSETTEEGDTAVYAYTPAFSGAGGARGRRTVRRAESPTRPAEQEQPVIHLQAHALEGSISQRGEMLELHLQELGPEVRGRYVTISVPLGSLIEPVRWIGGDPRAIRSAVPVDANGQLITPLGETALLLSNPEERNLLEAMFMLLEVRPAS
jgi:hypothetical protein